MIITVCLNPAVDKAIAVELLTVDGVNRVVSTRRDPGGKGINLSKVVRNLGGDTLAMGIIGGTTGAYIQKKLDQMGIRHDFVVREEATRVNLKISDLTRHTMTELNEAGEPVTDDELAQVWEKITAAAHEGDIVAFAGKNPPGMADGVLASWIAELHDRGVKTALDTVGEAMRLGVAAKPTIIKPNREELSEFYGEPLHYQRDVMAAAREIVSRGVERVVVSLGGEGAMFVTADDVLLARGIPVEVKSTVGSGDAMLAALLLGIERGDSWEDTAKLSVATATANVMMGGSEPPTPEQIKPLLEKVQTTHLI